MPELKLPPTNPDVLLGRIKTTFPDVTWSKFQYLDEGWDHEVVILDDRLVFRFPNDSEYLQSLRVEVEALRQLQPLIPSVRIPSYSYVAPDYSFAGYPFIQGQTLTRQNFDTLAPADRAEIAKQLAGFLSAMHAALERGHDFSNVPASDMAEAQAEDRKLAEKYLKPALNDADFALVAAILDDTDKILSQTLPSVLLHGDVYSRHLFWDAEPRRLGIIDFSDMNRGDPAFDFAELYEYGKKFVNEVYDYYLGSKDATFLERAVTYQKWVGVFMMADHFAHHKTSFAEARKTFDRTKHL